MINGGVDGIRNTYGQRLGLETFLWGGVQNAVRHEFRDNENLRLGEGIAESAVGYWGFTLDGSFDLDMITLKGQINYLGATDNADDKDDPDYDGEGDLKMPNRDFSGIVGNIGATTKVSMFDLGGEIRMGIWEEKEADLKTTAMVFEGTIGMQLTNSIKFELKPAYQMIKDEFAGADNDDNRIVLSQKWIYNFGGFDFWLRGEHVIRDNDAEPDFDKLTNAIHAAFEVKF